MCESCISLFNDLFTFLFFRGKGWWGVLDALPRIVLYIVNRQYMYFHSTSLSLSVNTERSLKLQQLKAEVFNLPITTNALIWLAYSLRSKFSALSRNSGERSSVIFCFILQVSKQCLLNKMNDGLRRRIYNEIAFFHFKILFLHSQKPIVWI